MEKQKATFKAFSNKTGGVCLDLGSGDVWFKPTDKVKNFVSKVQRGSEVFVLVDEDKNLSFIQNNGTFENYRNGNGTEGVTVLDRYYKRMSALKNATNLVIAKNSDSVNEEEVLQVANKFIEFLEKAE